MVLLMLGEGALPEHTKPDTESNTALGVGALGFRLATAPTSAWEILIWDAPDCGRKRTAEVDDSASHTQIIER